MGWKIIIFKDIQAIFYFHCAVMHIKCIWSVSEIGEYKK